MVIVLKQLLVCIALFVPSVYAISNPKIPLKSTPTGDCSLALVATGAKIHNLSVGTRFLQWVFQSLLTPLATIQGNIAEKNLAFFDSLKGKDILIRLTYYSESITGFSGMPEGRRSQKLVALISGKLEEIVERKRDSGTLCRGLKVSLDPNNYIRIRNLLSVQVADNSIVFSSNVNGLSDDLEILKTETGTSVTVWPWRVIGMGGGSYLALEILKPW